MMALSIQIIQLEFYKQFEQFGSYMVISPHIALIHAGTDYVQNGVGFALDIFH